MVKSAHVTEAVHAFEPAAEFAVDADHLRGAALLGTTSRDLAGNIRRTYPTALLEAAAPSFTNAKVYANHDPEAVRGTRVRGVGEAIGRVVKAWYDPASQRIRGDVRLYGTAAAKELLMIAKEDPAAFGFSPFMDLTLDERGRIVTSIARVRSVDLVTEPATTASLREDQAPDGAGDTEMTLEELKAKDPAGYARVIAEAKADLEAGEEAKAFASRLKSAEERATKAEAEAKAKAEALAVSESRALVTDAIGKATDLAEPTRARVRAAFEGKVATAESVAKAIEEERAYAKALSGKPAAHPVIGAGPAAESTGVDPAKVEAVISLIESVVLGVPKVVEKKAAVQAA